MAGSSNTFQSWSDGWKKMLLLRTRQVLQMSGNGVGMVCPQASPEITKKAANTCFLRVKWPLNAPNLLKYTAIIPHFYTAI